MVGITKVRYPTIPPAIITNNQKVDIPPPEELCYREKGKQAKQLQELQELNSVSCGGKNVKNVIAGSFKNYYTAWQEITTDRVILDVKNV